MASPAQKSHQKINLNLIYPQGIPQKLPVKLLAWTINYARYILLGVEAIVLIAFGLNFKFSQDLNSIQKQIDDQLPFIEQQKQQEAVIEQTQQRFTLINKIYTANPKWNEVSKNITDQIPLGVKFSSFTVDKEKPEDILTFKVSAESNSNNDLAAFLNNLKAVENFQKIELSNIALDQGVLTFTITGEVKQ